MAGPDPTVNAARALAFKEQGNKCFQAGEFKQAEQLYTNAINADPTNPLLYTNHAMALLSLSKTLPHAVPLTPQLTEYYESVISDSQSSIRLLPENMKAYYFLAQAQIALSSPQSALASAKKAHELCVQETYRGGKGASSIGPITELVLRAKKEVWEMREREREDKRGGLVNKMIRLLEKDAERKIEDLRYKAAIREIADLDMEERKVREEEERECDEVRNMGVAAGIVGEEEGRRRKVPDWAVDDITFSVMLDPVVTKTGQSYDRSSIMEHLKRSPTDPLTRAPLRIEDLRPNLALKEACAEFLEQNGWAVDW